MEVGPEPHLARESGVGASKALCEVIPWLVGAMHVAEDINELGRGRLPFLSLIVDKRSAEEVEVAFSGALCGTFGHGISVGGCAPWLHVAVGISQ